MRSHRQIVTVVTQTSVNGKVVSATPRQSLLTVYTRVTDGTEYVKVAGAYRGTYQGYGCNWGAN